MSRKSKRRENREEKRSISVLPKDIPATPEMVSLEQWFVARGIRPQHRGGMRVFVKKDFATMAEFDELFQKY